jgi:hypothetical protein
MRARIERTRSRVPSEGARVYWAHGRVPWIRARISETRTSVREKAPRERRIHARIQRMRGRVCLMDARVNETRARERLTRARVAHIDTRERRTGTRVACVEGPGRDLARVLQMHFPATHMPIGLLSHAVPHIPQLAGSVRGSMHPRPFPPRPPALQSMWPGAQHGPPSQPVI